MIVFKSRDIAVRTAQRNANRFFIPYRVFNDASGNWRVEACSAKQFDALPTRSWSGVTRGDLIHPNDGRVR